MTGNYSLIPCIIRTGYIGIIKSLLFALLIVTAVVNALLFDLAGHHGLRDTVAAELGEQSEESGNVAPLEPVHVLDDFVQRPIRDSLDRHADDRAPHRLSLAGDDARHLGTAGDQRQQIT